MGRESPIKSEFAVALRQAKKRLGLNVQEVAAKAGVAHGTVVKVLQGDNGLLLRHIEAVAHALGLQTHLYFSPPLPPPPPEPPEEPLEIAGTSHGVRFTFRIENVPP